MIKLSNRLMTIAKLVDLKSTVVDIGCDHGLLGIYLATNKIVNNILLVDVNHKPLKQANNNILKYKCHNINTKISDGLSNVDSSLYDSIIISGLGSNTIIDIISADYEKIKNIKSIIIQSNNDCYKLRKFFYSINYIVKSEEFVFENGIIYVVIKFVNNKNNIKYNNEQLFFGPIFLENKNDLFYDYFLDKKKKFEKIYLSIPSKSKENNEKKEKYKKLVDKIEKEIE